MKFLVDYCAHSCGLYGHHGVTTPEIANLTTNMLTKFFLEGRMQKALRQSLKVLRIARFSQKAIRQ